MLDERKGCFLSPVAGTSRNGLDCAVEDEIVVRVAGQYLDLPRVRGSAEARRSSSRRAARTPPSSNPNLAAGFRS